MASNNHKYNPELPNGDKRSTFNDEPKQLFSDVMEEQREAAEQRLADLIEVTRKELT